MTDLEIKRAIKDHYGLSGNLSRFDSYDDLIARIDDETGQSFILKIYHPKHSNTGLLMQMEFMDMLDKQLDNYEIPCAIRSLDGKIMPVFQDRRMTLHPFISGKLMGDANPILPVTRKSLGEMLGYFQKVTFGIRLEGDYYESNWDNAQPDWIGAQLHIYNDDKRPVIERVHNRVQDNKVKLSNLRKSIIHNDANDQNLFVNLNDSNRYVITGAIDFGDSMYTYTINDVAIACAYSMMGCPDPLEAVCDIIQGYHQIFPLQQDEVELLLLMIQLRLIISYTHSTVLAIANPEHVYIQLHNQPAWDLLLALDEINPDYAHYMFRTACGWEADPSSILVKQSIKDQEFFPLFGEALTKKNSAIFDLSVESKYVGSLERMLNTARFSKEVFSYLDQEEKKYGIGRYDEIRLLYNAASFAHQTNNGPTWRTLHLGIDVFAPAGTPIYAPLKGSVVMAAQNDLPKDYGHVIVLEHRLSEECTFYTLYGHLSHKSIQHLKIGQTIDKGMEFAWLGDHTENGDWVPHVHFQLMTDLLGNGENFPGVADPRHRDLWLSLSPDPNLILGIDLDEKDYYQIISGKDLSNRRSNILPKNLSVSFSDDPLTILRGQGAFLFDHHAQAYLDTVNNVAHVGHENADVVVAGQEQMAVLNTNTRYLHPAILDYAEALKATLPDNLEVIFFCNSGSEANDLAMRLAKTYTNAKTMVVLEQGYHGHTQKCIEASSYKFESKGGTGLQDHIIKLDMPDIYRGKHQTAKAYVEDLTNTIDNLDDSNQIAAFIGEAILSCGGQIVPPEGYYPALYQAIRRKGGVCIADEVQTGFGRIGSHFWAFEMHGVTPDIVTMGKPIGNGHPLSVVATTRLIANAFDNGMEYFNTFAGNPVSCSIGHAVLKYVQEHDLQTNASIVGSHLLSEMKLLEKAHPCIGDLRGSGLFLGIEIVEDVDTKLPAKSKADYLVSRMKDHNIQMSTDGPDHNVLKIKPPMVFDKNNADHLLKTLEKILGEDYMQLN